MTGMGDDGSKGIVDVKKNGGITVAEDPKSAILWAMPENAIKTGCVDFVLKKDEIPEFLVKIDKIKLYHSKSLKMHYIYKVWMLNKSSEY